MNKKKVLTVFSLAMINVSAIATLKNLPFLAEYGLSVIFFMAIAIISFFIPAAFISAELATGWPKTGGVYIWVREALGHRLGFVAIWLQWVENVIWYPTILSFAAGTLAYLLNPSLASNKLYTVIVVLSSYWIFTIINFLGMKISSLVSTIGVLVGTVLPTALIIILGIYYLLQGHTVQPGFWDLSHLNPMQFKHIAYFVGVILAFSGIEMSAAHAEEVKKPQRDYPRAILLSAVIIIAVSVLGALSISMVVPRAEISLVAGVMEAFAVFLNEYNLNWLIPVMSVCIVIGVFGSVTTWIVGPVKGLLATAQYGDLPPLLQRTNKNGMPVLLLLIQGIIVSILALIFLFLPTVSTAFWILTALTAQLYLIMYILMFISAIKLRYKKPNVKRTYRLGKKNFGMWCTAILGIIACIVAIGVGFFPPVHLKLGDLIFYESFLIGSIIVLFFAPIGISLFKSAHWKSDKLHKD